MSSRLAALLLLSLAAGACAPVAVAPVPRRPVNPMLPPIPVVDGPLAVRVAWPKEGSPRPEVDSTFVFGSVGSGRAALAINGTPVEVAPNGAFLAFLPLPADGVYGLVATRGGESARGRVAYRVPVPADATPAPARTAAPARTVLPQPLSATISGAGVSDTLATGSDVAPGYPVPSTAGDRRWLLPRGARAIAVSRQNGMTELRLDASTSAWVADSLVTLGPPAPVEPVRTGEVSARAAAGWVDVRVPARGAPFLVTTDGATASLTLYGVAGGSGTGGAAGDPLLAGATWLADSAGTARLDVRLTQPVWGYKAFYDPDGTLVLRLRRPPRTDPAQPLRGLRVVVDAGHPPGGAIGPTGLTEPEANLAIALRVAERLRARGAEVVMTRSTPATMVSATNSGPELNARVALAVRSNADILLSIHNNAFPEGVNPFTNYGTSVLYFHPQSLELARTLDREIARVTGIPDLGAKFQNIALGRPTWMPAVLTESLFMMFPEQENALRDPAFLDRLAEAHVRGLEAFLRARAAR